MIRDIGSYRLRKIGRQKREVANSKVLPLNLTRKTKRPALKLRVTIQLNHVHPLSSVPFRSQPDCLLRKLNLPPEDRIPMQPLPP